MLKISTVAATVRVVIEERQHAYYLAQESEKWNKPKKQGFFSKIVNKLKNPQTK